MSRSSSLGRWLYLRSSRIFDGFYFVVSKETFFFSKETLLFTIFDLICRLWFARKQIPCFSIGIQIWKEWRQVKSPALADDEYKFKALYKDYFKNNKDTIKQNKN